MMRIAILALSLSFSIPAFGFAADGSTTSAEVTYHFENPKLQPAIYTFLIREDGSGHFHSEPGEAPPSDTDGITPQPQDRDIRIAEPLRKQIFDYAHAHKYFVIHCDIGNEHIAFTGKHTFAYAGPAGQGSCTFNYAKDPVLEKLSGSMIAMAFTLEEGRRLAVQHTHSKLSLDAELETLQEAAKDSRAQGLENIAPELQAIIDDENVMARARARAKALLKTDPARASR